MTRAPPFSANGALLQSRPSLFSATGPNIKSQSYFSREVVVLVLLQFLFQLQLLFLFLLSCSLSCSSPLFLLRQRRAWKHELERLSGIPLASPPPSLKHVSNFPSLALSFPSISTACFHRIQQEGHATLANVNTRAAQVAWKKYIIPCTCRQAKLASATENADAL